MRSIKFSQLNIRYMIFEKDGEYFILDRYPSTVFALCFFPLNWFFTKPVYSITKEEFDNLLSEKNRRKSIAMSTVFLGGLGYFLSQYLKPYDRYLTTSFSFGKHLMIYFLIFLLSCLTIYLLNRRAFKGINRKINLATKPIRKIRCFPIVDKQLIQLLLMVLGLGIFAITVIVLQFLLNSWTFILGAYLATFLLLSTTYFAYTEQCRYRSDDKSRQSEFVTLSGIGISWAMEQKVPGLGKSVTDVAKDGLKGATDAIGDGINAVAGWFS